MHRGEITQTARECQMNSSRVTVKYGYSGRILLGPRSKSGPISLPISNSVAASPSASGSRKTKSASAASVAVENPVGYFSAVRTLTFNVPEGARPGEFEVYVGFDRPAPKAGWADASSLDFRYRSKKTPGLWSAMRRAAASDRGNRYRPTHVPSMSEAGDFLPASSQSGSSFPEQPVNGRPASLRPCPSGSCGDRFTTPGFRLYRSRVSSRGAACAHFSCGEAAACIFFASALVVRLALPSCASVSISQIATRFLRLAVLLGDVRFLGAAFVFRLVGFVDADLSDGARMLS